MPNTIDSFRFSTDDKQQLGMMLAQVGTNRLQLEKHTPAEAPLAWEQQAIEDRANTFRVAQPKLPPWMSQVIVNRDTFLGLGIAVAVEDGGMPESFFVVALCTQRPTTLSGFRAVMSPRPWPAVGEAGGQARLSQELGHHFYSLEETACIDAMSFGFVGPETLVVLEGVIHMHGGLLVVGEPGPLLGFRCMHDKARAARCEQGDQPKAVAKPRVTEVVLSRLLHDYHWLTEADVEVVLSRPRTRVAHRPGAPDIAAAPQPDDEAVEIAYEDVERELHDRRLEWVMPDEEMTQHFYTQVRGGAWTARMTGVAADSLMVKCRAHSAGFCHRFNLPKQKTFAFAKYGQAAAAELGREWCRFLNHYMEV